MPSVILLSQPLLLLFLSLFLSLFIYLTIIFIIIRAILKNSLILIFLVASTRERLPIFYYYKKKCTQDIYCGKLFFYVLNTQTMLLQYKNASFTNTANDFFFWIKNLRENALFSESSWVEWGEKAAKKCCATMLHYKIV